MLKLNKLWKEWKGFIVFILMMIFFRSSIADWYTVPTGSMKPTIIEGDRIFVNKLAYDIKTPLINHSIARRADPGRGDIVVFNSPANNQRLVKRVVGLPGDIIEMQNNRLYINGEPAQYLISDQSPVSEYWGQDETHPVLVKEYLVDKQYAIAVNRGQSFIQGSFAAFTVPEEHYFMLGDNRDNSADSRFIGPIHRKQLIGRANYVLFSFNQSERFFDELE